MKYHKLRHLGHDDMLEMTPEEYARVKAAADKLGVTVEDVVKMAVERGVAKLQKREPQS